LIENIERWCQKVRNQNTSTPSDGIHERQKSCEDVDKNVLIDAEQLYREIRKDIEKFSRREEDLIYTSVLRNIP